MSAIVRAFVVAAFLVNSACADDAPQAQGAELLLPFKQDLKQALLEGMQQGPVAAIGACRIEAPKIAATLSQGGVKLGRSSHRLRNPANAAPDWVTPVLAAYVASDAGWRPELVQLPGDRVGYVEPVVAQTMCLTCHGDKLIPDLATKIAELYPEDRATGFREGDLRGVFWVEYSPARRTE